MYTDRRVKDEEEVARGSKRRDERATVHPECEKQACSAGR